MQCCQDCLVRFIDMSLREQTPPRCMSPSCRALYLRTQIPSCHQKVYDLALYRGLLKDPGLEEDIQAKQKRQALLSNIVEERRRFLSESFPTSVRQAVEILYPHDLKRVQKDNQEFLDKMDGKRCFRSFCRGFMTSDAESKVWTCHGCESRFCCTCEQTCLDDHVCNKEEVESIQWKRALPSCPKCHLPIEKSEGCRYMTCGMCQQNFDYYTGELTDQGNHGASPVLHHPQEHLTHLYVLLLRGREVESLGPDEKHLYDDLKRIEKHWDVRSDTLSEWRVSQVIPLTNTESSDEVRLAKVVAMRVERIERKRQNRRAQMSVLRDIEDRILKLKPA